MIGTLHWVFARPITDAIKACRAFTIWKSFQSRGGTCYHAHIYGEVGNF